MVRLSLLATTIKLRANWAKSRIWKGRGASGIKVTDRATHETSSNRNMTIDPHHKVKALTGGINAD